MGVFGGPLLYLPWQLHKRVQIGPGPPDSIVLTTIQRAKAGSLRVTHALNLVKTVSEMHVDRGTPRDTGQ